MLTALRFALNLWVVVGYIAVAVIFGWWLMLVAPLVVAAVIIIATYLWTRALGE